MRNAMLAAFFLAFLAGSSALPLAPNGNNWAVLVAGSNTWMNYRHQADVYHAHQLMRKHGIEENHIIVMHYDDIAHSKLNPTPGIVINKVNGTDVYKGVPKDYTGLEVTVENFLNVLKGEKKEATGKVLKSGPKDHVFVNFVDHGAPGLVAFPHERMYADQLADAIKAMHDTKMFSQLVFYVEACEAGSMFADILPDDINAYVVTASNSSQSSYACYFDKLRKTYLGDVFSVKWMENEDKMRLSQETLQTQFELVKKQTVTSNVSRFGDMKFTDEDLDDFMAGHSSNISTSRVYQTLKSAFVTPTPPPPHPQPHPCEDAVSNRDVRLAVLYHQIADAENPQEIDSLKSQLHEELTIRRKITKTLELAVASSLKSFGNTDGAVYERLISSPAQPRTFDCYRPVVEHFSSHCFDLSQYDFGLKEIYKLSNLCEHGISTETIISALSDLCS
eukprot:m.306657 g.306657  ORF g.306657 m.306657 type:complete len:448 (+) comp41456_c0_seq1:930-2273(+)